LLHNTFFVEKRFKKLKELL